MRGLFALPRAGLEARVIESLRFARDRWPVMRLHPAVRQAAIGVAAVLMLAGFGYVADQRIEGEAGSRRATVASNLRQIGQAINLYSNDNRGVYPRTESVPASAWPSSDSWVKRYSAQASRTSLRGGFWPSDN